MERGAALPLLAEERIGQVLVRECGPAVGLEAEQDGRAERQCEEIGPDVAAVREGIWGQGAGDLQGRHQHVARCWRFGAGEGGGGGVSVTGRWALKRWGKGLGGTNLTSRAGEDPENGQKVSLLACVANSETHIKNQFPKNCTVGGAIFHNVLSATVKQQLTWKHWGVMDNIPRPPPSIPSNLRLWTRCSHEQLPPVTNECM